MMARRSAGLLLVVQLFVIKKLGVHKSFSVTCRGPGFEKEGAVNFGLLMSFRNSSRNELSFSELYRRHVDLCVEAEDLGFDTIWLTEHHFVEDGYSPSMLPLAAAIAARTRRIRIGTFVLLLPLHNPLRVAEDAATVDIISNGRLDLGLGQGYRVPEFTGFGVPRKERGARLEEGTEIIRRAWTEDGFSFDGRFNRLRNITLSPK